MPILTLINDDKFSTETREAMAFLRTNDPSGAFAFVGRAVLEAADAGICLNADTVELMVCNLARVLDVVQGRGTRSNA
jgi:hypothetical protein